ncbi:MAG TPA: DMT family transporter [Thermoplasmata archaeon]|nr:DMT family transporter [Thermoplasmata archaeon]
MARAADPPANADPFSRARLASIGLALSAAFAWATYYLFVLWVTPGTSAGAVLFYPFLAGGVVWLAVVAVGPDRRAVGPLIVDPGTYLRVALLVGMQLSVLAATYLAGPVDASLLSLLGDVVVTPLLAVAMLVTSRSVVGHPLFLAGLLLSLGGGTLAIVGGHRLAAVHGAGWLPVVGAPLTVGLYFLVSARAAERLPIGAIVGVTTIVAAGVVLLLAPLLPGGWRGIATIGPRPLALLGINGVVSFFLGPWAYFRAIAREGYVLGPMLMTGIPVFTLVLSALVLHLPVAELALVGIPIAVVGGVCVVHATASPAPRPVAPAG